MAYGLELAVFVGRRGSGRTFRILGLELLYMDGECWRVGSRKGIGQKQLEGEEQINRQHRLHLA